MTVSPMSSILRRMINLNRHPCLSLLVIQLLGVPLYAVLVDAAFGQTALRAFGLLVLGFALRVVRRSPAATSWALLMAGCVLLEFVLSLLYPASAHWTVGVELVQAAFYFYAAAALIAYMVADDFTTTDELIATAATFTVLAWAFAHVFMALEVGHPGSFTLPIGPHDPLSWFELLFLSFTTLSGVGLSDIEPVRRMARAAVMLEEFAGVMYLGMVVARVVGQTLVSRRHLRRMRRKADPAASPTEQRRVADLLDKLEWDESFDYKAERSRGK